MNIRALEALIKAMSEQENLWIEQMELERKQRNCQQDILELCKKIQDEPNSN